MDTTQQTIANLIENYSGNLGVALKAKEHYQSIRNTLRNWERIVNTSETFTVGDLLTNDVNSLIALCKLSESDGEMEFVELCKQLSALVESQAAQPKTEIDTPIETALSVDTLAAEIENKLLENGHGVSLSDNNEKLLHLHVGYKNGKILLHTQEGWDGTGDYTWCYEVGVCIADIPCEYDDGLNSSEDEQREYQSSQFWDNHFKSKANEIAIRVISDLREWGYI
jgi:hypothetical protein